MSNRTAALRFTTSTVWIAIASLVVALFLPILTATQNVQAAQILDRYIHMDSSAAGVETTYYVEFQVPATTSTVDSIRVEFCNENPLPGVACDGTTVSGDNVPDLDASAGNVITLSTFQFGTAGASVGTAGTDNTTECTGGSLQTVNAGDNYFDYECDTAENISVGTDDFVFMEVTDVNNPTNTTSGVNNDSFYARIYIWETGPATAYNQSAPPLGDHEGGVALSTAEQITVEARVQETLTFTVGVDDQADDCDTIAGSTVELGVLDGSNINYASVDGFNQASPNTDVACAEVTTNASDGVNVYYVGDNLSVGSTVCADNDTDKETNDLTTDECINRDSDPDAGGFTTMAGNSEQWGLGVSAETEYGSITNTMSATAAYDIDTADEYAFVPNAVTQIASSTGVLDQAVIEIDMAAASSITTPTGIYDTTLTFIATAQF